MRRVECKKIVIIEDDDAIRETFRLCLEADGYGVETYSNGQAGIEGLRHVPEPCLILLDLMMPVMNGAEFMDEFKKLSHTIVPIPVYLCSATASEKDSEKMGCRGFIKKPVDLNVLMAIVEGFCESNCKAA
jgi:two-component system chemotaxis response regulator CheY